MGPAERPGDGQRRLRGGRHFRPSSPNLWWPDDRAWCVATEIDLDSTYVGGTTALVDELLHDARFEALPVQADDVREDAVNGAPRSD